MLKWYAFLFILIIAVGIFIVAPTGLVARFIALFTPPGLEWVGPAFAVGLSLSIVSNAFLARWKSMRPMLIALIVLSLAEGAMSGTTLYLKALEDKRLDAIVGIGIFSIIAMQEAVLISGGIGLSMVLNKISERAEQKAKRIERKADDAERRTERTRAWAKMSKRKRIETLWNANPSLTLSELSERAGASKAHTSEVLSELKARDDGNMNPQFNEESQHRAPRG